jgi:hypothetical protein
MTKIHFAHEGSSGEFSPNGEYETPIESALPHRFELRDGKVVDKYNGISDEEVKLKDHEDAVKAALANKDHEDKAAPLPTPPPLGWVAPEDHAIGNEVPQATLKNLTVGDN